MLGEGGGCGVERVGHPEWGKVGGRMSCVVLPAWV